MSSTSFSAPRLVALDAYRGFMMLFMAFEGWRLATPLMELYPHSEWAQFTAWHFSHAAWRGCAAWDLIQPSFTFLVGAALVFSLKKRQAVRQHFWRQWGHVLWRSVVLVLLGVFLRSAWSTQTYWTFEDTLTQIGLGYPFLFLLSYRSIRTQWVVLAVILVGYWAAFALYPIPAHFDYAAVGCPIEGRPDFAFLSGFAAHWQANANLAWAFDTWFLNLFPRINPFLFNGGGYATLSFVPTLGTQLLGLLAGQLLVSEQPALSKVKKLLIYGLVGLLLSAVLDSSGICPSVKRIWTPAWVLWSGGLCAWLLASFYYITEVKMYRRWAFPLVVVGMNALVFYVLSDSHIRGYVAESLKIHFGQGLYNSWGLAWGPLLEGLATLVVFWLMAWWLWRNRIFIRV